MADINFLSNSEIKSGFAECMRSSSSGGAVSFLGAPMVRRRQEWCWLRKYDRGMVDLR